MHDKFEIDMSSNIEHTVINELVIKHLYIDCIMQYSLIKLLRV